MVDANYNYSDSVWQDIYKHLKSNGLDVYSPSTKTGECTKEYVVVKDQKKKTTRRIKLQFL